MSGCLDHGSGCGQRRTSCNVQALIQRVTEEVEAESGVELDQLINPAKVNTHIEYHVKNEGRAVCQRGQPMYPAAHAPELRGPW